MSRHHSHLTTAITIIQTAKAGEPLVHHLKKTFASNKKFGGKDRKSITVLCYNFYRIGNALALKSIEERIVAATFLCNQTSNDLLQQIAPTLNEKISLSFVEKCAFLNIFPNQIFAFITEIGNGIDANKFAFSFLKQPQFFIRIRPFKKESVIKIMSDNNIIFTQINANCIALPQGFKTDEWFVINEDVVIQDYNSQQVFNYLLNQNNTLPKVPTVWDCCAASGGKSILLYDILNGKLELTVSDIRESILNNLRARFKTAGIKKYKAFATNLLTDNIEKNKNNYDIVVCDAPCTGSGTWARTPEQLAFFTKNKITEFATIQKKIASKALEQLQQNGLFFYITCSIFKKENEEVVSYLKQKFHLQVLQMEYYKGYETQADTMFVAVLSF